MNRFIRALSVLILFAASVAFASTAALSYVNITRIGTYWNTSQAYDSVLGGQPGGKVVTYLCDSTTSQALLTGDVVYISRNNMVAKSATIANYNTVAGVVVGGSRTNMQAAQAITNFANDTSCLATGSGGAWQNNKVLVLTNGRTWVKVDAAAGIPPGTLLLPSTTTAGKVKGNAASLDSLQRTIGRIVDTGIVSTQVLANINIK